MSIKSIAVNIYYIFKIRNIKKIIVTILLVLGLGAHCQKRYSENMTYENNDLIYLKGDSSLVNGIVFHNYGNEKTEKSSHEISYKNGQQHGYEKWFFDDGDLQSKEIYKKGIRRLYVSYYYPSLNKKYKCKTKKKEKINKIGYKINKHDLEFNEKTKSRKEISWEWDFNGNLINKVIRFQNYVGCHYFKEWYESGEFKSKGIGYVENHLKTKEWYQNGKLKKEYNISKWTNYLPGFDKNGKRWDNTGTPLDGSIKFYYENGKLDCEHIYNNGLKTSNCWDNKGNKIECKYPNQ